MNHHKQIYKGYIDDPRNTDNAWMESVCVNFHDETGELLTEFKLEAGKIVKYSFKKCLINLCPNA